MISLLNTVKTRLEELLDGELFDDPQGGTRAPRYFVAVVPPKRDTEAQGEDFPFCSLLETDFTLTRTGRHQMIEVDFGLFTSGNHAAGMADIDRLLTKLEPLIRSAFAPFKLVGEIQGRIKQPHHPFYGLVLEITFSSMSADNC